MGPAKDPDPGIYRDVDRRADRGDLVCGFPSTQLPAGPLVSLSGSISEHLRWVMPSEMFPPATRGKAVGVAIAANYLSNFIVALITPWMLQSITFGTFYFFLVFSITLGVWTYFCVPETNGVPIEEMDTLFGGNEGEADLQRIASIRARLGFETSEDRKMVLEETKHDSVEHRERVD